MVVKFGETLPKVNQEQDVARQSLAPWAPIFLNGFRFP